MNEIAEFQRRLAAVTTVTSTEGDDICRARDHADRRKSSVNGSCHARLYSGPESIDAISEQCKRNQRFGIFEHHAEG